MTWFTETPWPPIFLLLIAAAAMIAIWSSQKKGFWLLGALAAIVAAVAVFFVEKQIITETERVEQDIYGLTNAFVRKDANATLAFFSQQAPELQEMARQALEWVDLPNGIDVKDMHVRLSNENTRAVTHFRANGAVSFKGMGTHAAASRWEVTWQKEGGDWKIIQVERLHPLKDERMRIFDQRPD